jgi:hypothetical protein
MTHATGSSIRLYDKLIKRENHREVYQQWLYQLREHLADCDTLSEQRTVYRVMKQRIRGNLFFKSTNLHKVVDDHA